MNLTIKKYSAIDKADWNLFIDKAKNGHFMFYRDYMDYHNDRFHDFSLMVYNDKHNLIALLPTNIEHPICYSHKGLTFGGLITDNAVKTKNVIEIFYAICSFFKLQGFTKLIYKCIPYIYTELPAEEDRYALFLLKGQLIRRDISSTINLNTLIKLSDSRKNVINKAKKLGLKIIEEKEFAKFWPILNEVLGTNHGVKPVHTCEEMSLLANKFPKNIRLFLTVNDKGQTFAGSVIYLNKQVVHTQYLATTTEGRKTGAMDLLLDYLINTVFKDKTYFDFGTSNEQNGYYLNEGLISQKEGFGARGIVHDIYEITI